MEYSDEPGKFVLKVEKTEKAYRLIYNRSFVLNLLQRFHNLRKNPLKNKDKVKEVAQIITQQINAVPFFKLKFKRKVSPKTRKMVRSLIMQYYSAEKYIAGIRSGQLKLDQRGYVGGIKMLSERINNFVDWSYENRRKIVFANTLIKNLINYGTNSDYKGG